MMNRRLVFVALFAAIAGCTRGQPPEVAPVAAIDTAMTACERGADVSQPAFTADGQSKFKLHKPGRLLPRLRRRCSPAPDQ